MKPVVQDKPVDMSKGDLLTRAGVIWSYLMQRSRWLTGISSSGDLPLHACHGYLRQLWVLVWILRGGEEEIAIGSVKMEGHKRMRAAANVDVLEAETLGWYL